MANDRVQEAIKVANERLEYTEVSQDTMNVIYNGNLAIASLLRALLQEVGDLRSELAGRKSHA